MFRMSSRLLFVSVLMVFIVGGCSSPNKKADIGSLVAVLCDSSRSIETIDTKELKIKDSIKLRSLSLDFTLNKKNNMIYTAQCGLLGKDSDNVVGEVDPYLGRVNKYIKLEYPNPSQIVSSDNTIYVVHGYLLKNGQFIGSAVPVTNEESIQKFCIPGIPNEIRIKDGNIYTLVTNSQDASDEHFLRLNPKTGAVTKLDLGEKFRLPRIAFDNSGNMYGLLYTRKERPVNSYSIIVFNTEQEKITKEIDVSNLKALEGEPFQIIWANNKLFVSLFQGTNLTGKAIAIIDPISGEIERLLEGFDEPSCMLVHENKLYVGEYSSKNLSVIDLSTYDIIKRIALKGRPVDILIVH